MCDYKTNKKNHLDRHIESHLKVETLLIYSFPKSSVHVHWVLVGNSETDGSLINLYRKLSLFLSCFSGLGSRSRVFLAPWGWSRLKKKQGAGAAWKKKSGA